MFNKFKVLSVFFVVLLSFSFVQSDLSGRAFSFSSLILNSDLIVSGKVTDVEKEANAYVMRFEVYEYFMNNGKNELEIISPLNNGFYSEDEAYLEKDTECILFIYERGGKYFITNRNAGYIKSEVKDDLKTLLSSYRANKELFTEEGREELKTIFNSFVTINAKRRLLPDLESILNSNDSAFLSSLINSDVKQFKIFGIQQAGRKKVNTLKDEVVNVLKTSADLNVMFHCIVALGDYKDGEYLGLLIPFLDSEKQYVRRAAVEALGKIRDKRMIEPLKRLYDKEEDFGNRMAIVTAVCRIKDKTNIKDTLKYFLSTENHSIVKNVLLKEINKLND